MLVFGQKVLGLAIALRGKELLVRGDGDQGERGEERCWAAACVCSRSAVVASRLGLRVGGGWAAAVAGDTNKQPFHDDAHQCVIIVSLSMKVQSTYACMPICTFHSWQEQ
jgi:hypothetical protein